MSNCGGHCTDEEHIMTNWTYMFPSNTWFVFTQQRFPFHNVREYQMLMAEITMSCSTITIHVYAVILLDRPGFYISLICI